MLVRDNVFGAFAIESHSNLAMQLCDVLLGAVLYEYKRKFNLNSSRTEAKKEPIVSKIRTTLGVTTLADEFTENSRAYFNVFECV